MINCKKEKQLRLKTQSTPIFFPTSGRQYAHHPFITYFNNRFIVAWSCGRENEDDLGQCVMLADSVDGVSWSEPRTLITPSEIGDENGVLTCCGFYQHNGILVAYIGYYCYDKAHCIGGVRPQSDASHKGTCLYALTSKDGFTFGCLKNMNLHMIPNHGPFVTKSGRLIICGNVMFPYSDDISGTGKFSLSGIYGKAFGDNEPIDDSDTINFVTPFNGWDARMLCEGSCFQTEDSVLHMVLRSNTERMWQSDSTDDGVTWSAPYKTDFSTDTSKFYFSSLSDGRYYCVCNPVYRSGRNPLTLFFSENGTDFDTYADLRTDAYLVKYSGLHKGGSYAYPHAIEKDGKLYTVYSIGKERIELSITDLT